MDSRPWKREIDCRIIRENRLGFGHLTDLPIEPLNRIGGIYNAPDLGVEFEIITQTAPVIPPGPNDNRIFLSPFLVQFL